MKEKIKHTEDVYDKKAKKIYVYEVEHYYDKEKKSGRKKRRILGHRDPVTGEILPNRPKRKKATDQAASQVLQAMQSVERKHFGASDYLFKVAKKINLVDDLKAVFPDSYQQLLQLAIYLVLAPTNSMKQFEEWQKSHYLPYDHSLTSQRISDLFRQVTEANKQAFFGLRTQRVKKSEYWYFDTTSISSYSQQLSYVQYGYNKEDDRLPQLNLGVVYGAETKLPVLYRYLNGNIPDHKTISWLISLIDFLPKEKVKLVMDRGFYQEANIHELISSNIGFIMGVKRNLKYVQSAIESVREEMEHFEQYSKANKLYGKRIAIDAFKPETGKGHYPVQLYLYFDKERATLEQMRLDEYLQTLNEELTTGQLQEGHQKDYKKYFEDVDKGFLLKREVVTQAKKAMGYFGLISSYKLDVWEVLSIYRNKEVVEDAFHNLKDRTNLRRMRVSSEESLEGKMFVQFLALTFIAYLKRELEATKLNETYTLEKFLSTLNRIDVLSHPTYGETISEMTVEQKLLYTKTGLKFPE